MSGWLRSGIAALALAGAVTWAQAEEPKVAPAEVKWVTVTTQAATQRLMVAVDTVVVAQAIVPNPEYDRIIAEAKAAGKDPVDYALSKWKSDAFAEWLDKYILKKAAIEDGRRIAGKEQAAIARRAQEWQLDQAAIRAIAENNSLAIKFIWVLETNRKKWINPNEKELAHLKKIYNDSETYDHVRKLIQEKFWDLFDFRTLVAQA